MIISFIIREQDIICIISELIQCWKLYRTKSINKVNQSDGSEFINNFVNNSICNKRIHQDERFMNRTTARQEHFKNAEVISKFYLEVLSSFIDKLYKENKYRKNIAEESIQSLQRIVKAQLNHQFPSKINQQFQNLLLKKQNSKIDDFDFQNGQSSFSKAKTSNQERLTTIKFNTQLSRGNEEDQYIDDLAQFTPVDPQKQEQPQIHLTKEAEPKEEQDDQSDSEIDYSEKIQEKIGTSLIGTFCSFQIKRRPKEEKIFVQLYNVFVKYCNSPLENYYSKLTCQLTKIEKEEIKDLKR